MIIVFENIFSTELIFEFLQSFSHKLFEINSITEQLRKPLKSRATGVPAALLFVSVIGVLRGNHFTALL